MKKFICLLLMLVMPVSTAAAQDYQWQQGDRLDTRAGLFLKIRFGRNKARERKLDYGFRMTRSAPGNWSSFGKEKYRIQLTSINFSERGFEQLGFAGAPIFAANGRDTIWHVNDQYKRKSGGEQAVFILAGLVVMGGLVVLLNDICDDGKKCNVYDDL